MPTQRRFCHQRPRELRRLVIVPARLRTASGWGNACILNVSSRGLLVHAGRPVARGSQVELRHGPHAIRARVVWQSGGRFGAQAEHRVPVEDIAAAAGGGPDPHRWRDGRRERRSRGRLADRHRISGRLMQFASVAAIAASLAGGFALTVEQALARPLGYIASALSR